LPDLATGDTLVISLSETIPQQNDKKEIFVNRQPLTHTKKSSERCTEIRFKHPETAQAENDNNNDYKQSRPQEAKQQELPSRDKVTTYNHV